MQLQPRYGKDPAIVLDGDPSMVGVPAIRQRTRLVDTLSSLTADQWAHASRCEGWSVRDVIVHLDSTNRFWAASIAAGLRGAPTTFLATFDPVSSPAALVAATPQSWQEVLDGFATSTTALTDLWASLGDDGWRALAEGPPGHISVSAVTTHAMWDSWVHERDIVLPLGLAPVEDGDEIAACLRYAAGLGATLAANAGVTGGGTLAVHTTDPQVDVVVTIGDRIEVRSGTAATDLELSGGAVQLLEAFSVRLPFEQDIPADKAWMVNGLAVVFDGDLA